MPRFARLLLVAVAVLLAASGGAFLWLTAREAVPHSTDYVIDLAELRQLADSLPGARPSAVASALIAEGSLPKGAVFAGESLRERQPMVHQVFQVQWSDRAPLLIDLGFPPELLEKVGGGTFYPAAWQQVLTAMGSALQIVVTHEHFDHLAGASAAPPGQLAGHLLLTRQQQENREALDASNLPAELRSAPPLDYERVLGLAPGVVLVRAAGHTPGTQLVYVHQADDLELLFVGDVAWHLDQLTQLHYRPRLVTDLFLGEDRSAVLAQFRALHDLMRSHPQLVVVVSHDRDQRERLVAQGVLHDGLAP